MKSPFIAASGRKHSLALAAIFFLSTFFMAFRTENRTAGTTGEIANVLNHEKIPVGFFRLRNAKSGKYLAIGAGDPNQPNAIQWRDVRQKDLVWASDGSRIWNAQTGGLIGVQNTSDLLVRQLLECDNFSNNVKWKLTKSPTGGTVTLGNLGRNKLMGIEAGAKNDGDKAVFFNPPSQWTPLPEEFKWVIEPVFIKEFKLTVETGGDDLRGGNTGGFKLAGWRTGLLTYGYDGLKPNSTTNKKVVMDAWKNSLTPAKMELEISHNGSPRNGHPFDTYDNWDCNRVKVVVVANFGGEYEILNTPGVRFTGDLRKKIFYMDCPFMTSPMCIPG